MDIDTKIELLKNTISNYKKVIIAYSGGVDSSLLVKICADTLGNSNVIAVTGISQTYTEGEKKIAQNITAMLGVEHILLQTDELSNDDFANNPKDRCYHCKKELYGKIIDIAGSRKINTILDATNADDLKDYRPGRKAGEEFGVISPFVKIGINKSEIRELSRKYGLPTWDKPANPCLASRIPYGTRITNEILHRVEAGENIIKKIGISTVRLRHHGDIARIEVGLTDFPKFLSKEIRERVATEIKSLGYQWVSIDLEGYRTGSLNETISSGVGE